MPVLLALLLLLGSRCEAESYLAGLPLNRGAVFKKVCIPLGESNQVKPPMILEIREITIQPRRFDFLEISAIPQAVLEGVCIKLSEQSNPSASLRYLKEFSENNPAFQSGRLLNISFVNPRGEILLMAKEGFIRHSGRELLLRRVTLSFQHPQVEIPEAMLILSGSNAGRLAWKDSSGQALFDGLFPSVR